MSAAAVVPSAGPPARCEVCAQRKKAAIRTRNRLITAGQALIGTGQVALSGSGIWLFVVGQPLPAAAAAGLAGLGYPAIKMLSKLRRRR
ncbi:hypothetical protein ABT173_09985 [Streptomyces sp. NPDC001795]|uniref:hypothetical protein n=1 Tax=Streptomyces sp. NPDC001795 TaxID=3154525 RepID=UPI003332B356